MDLKISKHKKTKAVQQHETEAVEQQKSQLTFSDPNLSSLILSGLNQQREDDALTDIIICTANSRISAHKAVLSAFSPYFENILKQYPYITGEE